jgi:uncharacterized protein (TIGR02996 family)
MIENEAFLATILEHPDEDAPRLVYADWLEEQGETDRAEFIRVQIELAKLDVEPERRSDLELRESQLMRNKKKWLQPVFERIGKFTEYAAEFGFCRGFVESARMRANRVAECADALFSTVPLRELKAYEFQAGGFDLLFACSHLDKLISLQLDRGPGPGAFPAEFIKRLIDCPRLVQLRRLSLTDNGVGDREVEMLVPFLSLPSLRALDLSHNAITETGFAALFRGADFDHLQDLDLSHNGLGKSVLESMTYFFDRNVRSVWVEQLLSSPVADSLHRLRLTGNSLRGADRRALEKHFGPRIILNY